MIISRLFVMSVTHSSKVTFNLRHGTGTSYMVGIPADQNSPNEGPQAISEIVYIEYRIVCSIETYLIHIYHMSKCSKCN